MKGYYENKLAADRLKKCYDLASPRILQYLEAELSHVLEKIKTGDRVIELGCGYGRILPALCSKAKQVTGIDTSLESLLSADKLRTSYPNLSLALMNAAALGFPGETFDVTICIQNGISAFHVDPGQLINETIRVTKNGGIILFSSYASKFWQHRLQWFEAQSQAGLLGKIDYKKTMDGQIVCDDGFRATTFSPEQFLALTTGLGAKTNIAEIDESSLFCEIIRNVRTFL